MYSNQMINPWPLMIMLGTPVILILIGALIALFRLSVSSKKKAAAILVTATNGNATTRPITVYHRGQTIRYTNHLEKWIDIAWANTITMKIRRAYWIADAKVRHILWKAGWGIDSQ